MRDKLLAPKWALPLVFLLVLVAAFGVLIPQLGFYWDDWPVIFLAHTQGVSAYWDFYQFDRPFSAWTYLLTVPVLGTAPLNWHLLTLLLRWLAVIALWWGLRGLWLRHPRQAAWIALLFAVYPAFFQQSIAVAYSQHFMTYALFLLSLGAMVWAHRLPRHFWPLTALSLLAGALHMLTMEYFVGLELLRPALLWVLLREEADSSRERLARTARRWAPYLAVLLAFVVWRLFFLNLPDDPNAPRLLYAFREQPFPALLSLVESVLRDLLYVAATAWYRTLDPGLIDLRDRFGLFSWGVAFVVALGLALAMLRLRFKDEGPANDPQGWAGQAVSIGALGLFVGLLPVWLAGREILAGLYADRFVLPAMLGASILLVGLVTLLIPRRPHSTVVLALLVGLAVGLHLRTANEYRWDWVRQARFYWQLRWRAPDLRPGTMVVSRGAISGTVSGYAASMALNSLYPQTTAPPRLTYWYYEFPGNFDQLTPEFLAGMEVRDGLRNWRFSGSSRESVAVRYQPQGNCLWLLSERDVDNPELLPVMRQILPATDIDLVGAGSGVGEAPPADIFGPEPEYTWCYYFEKADLARQLGDWARVISLGEQAESLGYEPNNGYEYLPFIEAYAMRGDWERAQELSLFVYGKFFKVQSMMCAVWTKLEQGTPPGPQRQAALAGVYEEVDCPEGLTVR